LRTFSKLYLAFIIGIFLTACQPAPKEQKLSLFVFGTLVDVTLWGVDKQTAEQAVKDIETDLKFMHFAWHAWQPGPLGRVNELLSLAGEFSANPALLDIIAKSQQLANNSEHLFNPAIGHLIALWGYNSDDPPKGPPPDEKRIKKLLAKNPRMDDISIDHVRMKNKNAAVKLDLGAIAKGYALDRVVNNIKTLGVKNAIINAGGDIKAIGKHGDRNWHIGIRHPRKEGVLAGISLQDGESIFTSGDYERFYEHEGIRYHHIIDGRTGYPAQGVQSITVIHPDAATADAAATALFIAGVKDWHRIAKKMGIKYAMLIDTNGNIHLNPAMQKRLEFKDKNQQMNISAPL